MAMLTASIPYPWEIPCDQSLVPELHRTMQGRNSDV